MFILLAEEVPASGNGGFVLAVVLSLIVSVFAPCVLLVIQNHARKAERKEAWDRAQETAKLAHETAQQAMEQTESLAERQDAQHAELMKRTGDIVINQEHKLKMMYAPGTNPLLNARLSELRALESELFALQTVMRIAKDEHQDIDPNDANLSQTIRNRIADLKMRVIVGEFGSQEDDTSEDQQQDL